ncbi:putative ribonuclease H-like domain-containing protein [Tanacetum coccineum]
MNYQPMRSENQANKTASPEKANHSAGIQDNIDAGNFEMDADPAQDYFVLPIYSSYTSTDKSSEVKNKAEVLLQAGAARATSTNTVNTVSTPLSTANPSNVFNIGGPSYPNLTYYAAQYDSQIHALEDIYVNSNDGIFTNAYYDDEGAVADFTNLESTVNQRRNNHKDFQHCLFACVLSQIEPKKIFEALQDKIWVDAMQEELLQFKIQKVYKNKQDERGVVVRNKARLVAQGHRQEEGIDYDEVFAFARIEAIRIFLAFASYMGFVVNQMDAKSTFLYDTIDEEVYVSQPLGFVDPKFPKKFYKSGYIIGTIDKTLFIKKDKNDIMLVHVYVDDIIFGSTKRSWCDEFEALMKSRFQMSSMGELTFFLGLQKPLTKDEEAADVDVHLYRSIIGSLMYLTASRPDIMFAVRACSRVSSFDLEAYSDSDYAGANLDRKSITRGCQFLGRRLISWQCKKQTIMATSTTEAEYVAASNCCGQVLWIQNQMLDYGFNFMNIKIYIDNESIICIVKNPVFHSKTKNIKIRHHLIRDAYEKKLIQVLKIRTDDNVACLLTKAFDVSRFNFLTVNIGMINL